MKRTERLSKPWRWGLILGLGMGLFLWGTASAQAPIKVGASISLTGTYAKLGSYTQDGYQLCAREVNDKGGLLGRKIEFVIYDDRSDPNTAIKLYEKLITEDKVELVMGPYSSPVTKAASTVSEKYKKIMVASLAAETAIWERGFKYLFMTISPAEVYVEGVIDLAAERGLKTVAVINEDTSFARAAAAGSVDLAKRKGRSGLFHDAYPKGTTDFSGLLSRTATEGPGARGCGWRQGGAVGATPQMKELDVN